MIFCKDSANERNVRFLTNCRVPPIFCKDSANERNVRFLTNCRVPPIFCKDSDYFYNLLSYNDFFNSTLIPYIILQQQLQVNDIEPSIKLEAHLLELRNLLEA